MGTAIVYPERNLNGLAEYKGSDRKRATGCRAQLEDTYKTIQSNTLKFLTIVHIMTFA
jgi:hypothetical protein